MTFQQRRLRADNIFLVFFISVITLGGASRGDVQTLIILRPIAIFALFSAMVLVSSHEFKANRSLIFIGFAWAFLAVLHTINLPPEILQSFPNRQLITDIGRLTDLQEQWRPLSIAPHRTLNTIFALSVPLAALLLTLSIPRNKLRLQVLALTAAAFFSALVGLLQVIGGDGNPFYIYRVTNEGSAVGIFANRNHNALLLAATPPLIAAAVSILPQARQEIVSRGWLAAAVSILFVPFIIVTESRAGIFIGLLSIVGALWVYSRPFNASARRRSIPLAYKASAGGIALIAISMTTYLFSAENAFERLGRIGSSDDELRLQIWPEIANLAHAYLPWGSGFGTFVEAYQIAEPDELLQPRYINHAHNDFLELLLTGGLPAVALLIVGGIISATRGIKFLASDAVGHQDKVVRRLGGVIIAIIFLGSLYDYPVRTPIMAMVLAMTIVWFAGSPRRSAD